MRHHESSASETIVQSIAVLAISATIANFLIHARNSQKLGLPISSAERELKRLNTVYNERKRLESSFFNTFGASMSFVGVAGIMSILIWYLQNSDKFTQSLIALFVLVTVGVVAVVGGYGIHTIALRKLNTLKSLD